MSRYIEVDKAMELCNEFYFSNETCSVKALFDSTPTIDTKQVKYFDEDEKVWKVGEVIVAEQAEPKGEE